MDTLPLIQDLRCLLHQTRQCPHCFEPIPENCVNLVDWYILHTAVCSTLAFKSTDPVAKYTIKTCDNCSLIVNMSIFGEHQAFCTSDLRSFDITKVAAQAASVSESESKSIEHHHAEKHTKLKKRQELLMGSPRAAAACRIANNAARAGKHACARALEAVLALQCENRVDGRALTCAMSDLLYRKQIIFMRGCHNDLRLGKTKHTSMQPLDTGRYSLAMGAANRLFSDLACNDHNAKVRLKSMATISSSAWKFLAYNLQSMSLVDLNWNYRFMSKDLKVQGMPINVTGLLDKLKQTTWRNRMMKYCFYSIGFHKRRGWELRKQDTTYVEGTSINTWGHKKVGAAVQDIISTMGLRSTDMNWQAQSTENILGTKTAGTGRASGREFAAMCARTPAHLKPFPIKTSYDGVPIQHRGTATVKICAGGPACLKDKSLDLSLASKGLIFSGASLCLSKTARTTPLLLQAEKLLSAFVWSLVLQEARKSCANDSGAFFHFKDCDGG